ncbi:MAG: hypothetical protein HYR66_08870 [Sphingobacteriales bacterium]|nr:hypothetical protein [Sphingobacteriales bacterium]MBI3720800.1 hypothetical protein [Sphingobacteriales bacterium]
MIDRLLFVVPSMINKQPARSEQPAATSFFNRLLSASNKHPVTSNQFTQTT